MTGLAIFGPFLSNVGYTEGENMGEQIKDL